MRIAAPAGRIRPRRIARPHAECSVVFDKAALHEECDGHQSVKRCGWPQGVAVLCANAAIVEILGGTEHVEEFEQGVIDFGSVEADEDFDNGRAVVGVDFSVPDEGVEVVEGIEGDASVAGCGASTEEEDGGPIGVCGVRVGHLEPVLPDETHGVGPEVVGPEFEGISGEARGFANAEFGGLIPCRACRLGEDFGNFLP